jgi:hypothetical protein
MKNRYKYAFIMFVSILIAGCSDDFDINQFKGEGDPNIGGDTLYVQLNPAWGGFNNPQDICIGKEPFLYVCDTDNDRIVMMNLAGQILGSRQMIHPVAIAQDFALNLIVSSRINIDTTGTNPKYYNAVYKIDLVAAAHDIATAPMKLILPLDFNTKTEKQEYTGITTFYDNKYYVCRKGPANSTVIDPDNAILQFKVVKNPDGTKTDTYIGRIPLIDPLSSGIPSANDLSGITSFNKRSYDMIYTLTGNNSFKTQWMQYIVTQDYTGYISKLSPGEAEFITPNRFTRPEGVTVDDAGNIYVADAEKDSLFKFNSFGDELQSFGGPEVFNQPYAVAVFDRTLYVLDSGNNRILRFILSTDL